VDWSEAPDRREPAPGLEARVTTDKDTYNAGDIVTLTGTVTNHAAAGPAYQVHGRVRSDSNVFEDVELVFGRVAPGETRTWTTQVKLPRDARDRVDELSFEFGEARGAKVAVSPIRVRVV